MAAFTPSSIRDNAQKRIDQAVEAYQLDSVKKILMDYFVFNPENHQVENIVAQKEDCFSEGDCFPEIFMNEIKGKVVTVTEEKRDPNNFDFDNPWKMKKHIWISDSQEGEKQKIASVGYNYSSVNKYGKKNFSHGKLIFLNLPTTTEIGDDFLIHDGSLEVLLMNQVKTMGKRGLYANEKLHTLQADALEQTGDNCFRFNGALVELHLPNYKKSGYGFLDYNRRLTIFDAPKCTDCWVAGYQHATYGGGYEIMGLFGTHDMKTNAPFFVNDKNLKFKEHGRVLKTAPSSLKARLFAATQTAMDKFLEHGDGQGPEI